MARKVITPWNIEGDHHPVHRAFFDSVVTDYKEFQVPDYSGPFQGVVNFSKYSYLGARFGPSDVFLTRNIPNLRAAYVNRKIYSPKVIHFEAGSGFLHTSLMEQGMSLNPRLGEMIDGGIAVSPLAKKFVEKFTDCPVEVVHPFVSDKMRQEITTSEYDVEKGKILFVGKSPYRKGLDLLLEAFEELEDDSLELHIVGPEEHGYDTSKENVYDHGYVSLDELVKHYSTADLFVLPARADAHPVSVLEAMLAGTPVIMTESTGTKYLLGEMPDYLVAEPEAGEIADSIHGYFDDDLERDRFRTKVEDNYIEQEQIEKFQETFERLAE